jgi:hypothetical protein
MTTHNRLLWIVANDTATTAEMAAAFRISSGAAWRWAERMAREGVVERLVVRRRVFYSVSEKVRL